MSNCTHWFNANVIWSPEPVSKAVYNNPFSVKYNLEMIADTDPVMFSIADSRVSRFTLLENMSYSGQSPENERTYIEHIVRDLIDNK